MAWRDMPDRRKRGGGSRRKAALRRRVQKGIPVGLLAYANGEPVGWCSVAPRETFRPLGGAEQAPGEKVWSVVCFYIPRNLRRRGLSRRLLAAAVESSRRHGATVLEAYPVDPDSPSYRFMGYVPLFRSAGFRNAGRAGSRRHVMRLALQQEGRIDTRRRPGPGLQ
jgi:GNAT superfamily N-acetyltransferase